MNLLIISNVFTLAPKRAFYSNIHYVFLAIIALRYFGVKLKEVDPVMPWL